MSIGEITFLQEIQCIEYPIGIKFPIEEKCFPEKFDSDRYFFYRK